MVMINPKPNYKPVAFTGPGYYEINGKMVQQMMQQAQWVKADSLDLLRDRVVSETGSHDTTFPVMVYKGIAGGDTIGLLYGTQNQPLRMFGTDDDDAANSLLAELKENHGFLNQQMDVVGDILSNNNARALYAWEHDFFGEPDPTKLARISAVSTTKAKSLMAGTRSELIDTGEAIELAKAIAKKYDIANVELDFGTFDGHIYGRCKPSEDTVVPYTMPVGLNIFLAKGVLVKHTVVHEMAHGIEMFGSGLSGHGKNFRKIYKLLLKQFLGIEATGL